jgi:hypothetical protein
MRNISRAMRYLGNFWQPTLGGGLALLLVNAANLATPQLLRALIDQGITLLNMSRIVVYSTFCKDIGLRWLRKELLMRCEMIFLRSCKT